MVPKNKETLMLQQYVKTCLKPQRPVKNFYKQIPKLKIKPKR